MSRPLRAARITLGALLAGAVLVGVVGDSRARAETTGFPGNEAEYEVYHLADQEKFLTARTRAEAILREDPDSIVGHYVLGTVLREAEGSLARSATQLREARRLFEQRYGTSGLAQPAMEVHRDILIGLDQTAGLMEQYDEQLRILDEHDRLYEPHFVGQHAWPLMKLHRYDEARDWARRAVALEAPWQKSIGHNALCAIEAEAHERQPSYVECKAALDLATQRVASARARGSKVLPNVAVHAYNAALAALTNLHHDEAERLALEGTRRLERTASNPWRFLVQLYLGEGRAGDAVASIREMQRWCAYQPPEARDQKSAETDAVTATLLLAAGESKAGLRFITRALERPDRQGISSANPEQAIGGHAMLRRSLLRLDAELAAERASTLGPLKRGAGALEALEARASALGDDERTVGILSDDERLVSTLRPYLDGGLDDLPIWITGDLVAVLGPGVVAVALARARASDPLPEATPWFDSIDAEIALARGDLPAARSLAQGALDALPPAEKLLRARCAAIGAEAARRGHDPAGAAALYQRALELDPGTIRRLGLALPAVVRAAAPGEAPRRAAELLGRSPRLYEAAGAFEVRIEDGGSGPDGPVLRACLIAPFGTQLGCGEATAIAGEPDAEWAARLARDFHRAAFALHLPITDTDVRSLDGTTTMARDAGRERLRGILDDAPEPDEDPPPP